MQPCHPGSRPCVATRKILLFQKLLLQSALSLPCFSQLSSFHSRPSLGLCLCPPFSNGVALLICSIFQSFIYSLSKYLLGPNQCSCRLDDMTKKALSLTTSPNLAFQAVFQTLSFIHPTSANVASMVSSFFVNAEAEKGMT